MGLRRKLMILVAFLAFAFGALAFGLPWRAGGTQEPTAAACAICGDGVCAKSCETKYSCPRDCGVSSGATTSAAR
ncbi:MAG: hypothetical protein LC800_20210 [Acidobacteria bacterium]|nr:hypothetical protein [Acidobacteriota bacterium]